MSFHFAGAVRADSQKKILIRFLVSVVDVVFVVNANKVNLMDLVRFTLLPLYWATVKLQKPNTEANICQCRIAGSNETANLPISVLFIFAVTTCEKRQICSGNWATSSAELRKYIDIRVYILVILFIFRYSERFFCVWCCVCVLCL